MAFTRAEITRRHRERRYVEIAALPEVPCACGCGTLIAPFGRTLLPVRYAHGHNKTSGRFRPGRETWNRGKPAPWTRVTHCGKKLSPETLAKRAATRLERNGGVWQTKRGWKHSPETLAKVTAANRRNVRRGPANHWYGKRGAAAPGWRGGTGQLPYGPGFTRSTKRGILERDAHRCRRCGKHQSELKRKMQVHHLDHDKQNNDPTNLVAACCSCNIWASWNRHLPFLPHSGASTVVSPSSDSPAVPNVQ